MKPTSSEKVTYITSMGLEKLKNELSYLRYLKRREIAHYLQENWGEIDDTEYLIALEEQAFVEGRIRKLETLLCNVEIIQSGQNPSGVVGLGSMVVLQESDILEEAYTIVGAAEADPSTGLISNESPLGKALFGRKIGDDIEINVPAGLLKFRVLAVH